MFRNLSRFYILIEDKTETRCDVSNCRLIRQNVKKTTENKQYHSIKVLFKVGTFYNNTIYNNTEEMMDALVEDYFRYDELAQMEVEAVRHNIPDRTRKFSSMAGIGNLTRCIGSLSLLTHERRNR